MSVLRPGDGGPAAESASAVHAAWVAALDRLELDAILVEKLVRSLKPTPLEPWTPPALPGPIPADLVARAEAVRRRQDDAMAALAGALTLTSRQQGVAHRLATAFSPAPRPVYVDARA